MYREPGPSLSANPTWTLQQWDDANRQLRDQIDTLRGYEYDRREPLVGTVAKMVAVVVIIGTGLSLAFGDMSGGFRRLVQVVFGLSIAFAATSFFLSFFSFAGGAVIE